MPPCQGVPTCRIAVIERPDGASEPVALHAGRQLSFYEGVAAALTGDAPMPVDAADCVRALELIEAAVR